MHLEKLVRGRLCSRLEVGLRYQEPRLRPFAAPTAMPPWAQAQAEKSREAQARLRGVEEALLASQAELARVNSKVLRIGERP
jgi:hypothetical protein